MGTVAGHQLSTFTSPVNGVAPIDANTVRGNDNTVKVAYNAHDADTTIHLQNGVVASRPAASTAGQMWLATNTGAVYQYLDTGSAWVEVNYLRNTGGTVTGDLAVTGTIRATGALVVMQTANFFTPDPLLDGVIVWQGTGPSGGTGRGLGTFSSIPFATGNPADDTYSLAITSAQEIQFFINNETDGIRAGRVRLADKALDWSFGVLSAHATAGMGYQTGAGGTVTQGTSKSTGVTLNKTCGAITLNNASLASAASVTFTLTNSAIAATDLVYPVHSSGGTAGAYRLDVTAVAAGSCAVTVTNASGGSLSEAIVITFAVWKAVTA